MNALWKAVAVVGMVLGMAQAHAEFVSIGGNTANIRKDPSTQSTVEWELAKGYPLKVTQKRGNWVKVRDFEGDLGWVYRPLTQKKAHHIVKSPTANMRTGPGTQYKKVETLSQYDLFRTLEKKNGWVKGETSSGTTGWISQKLLWGW